MRLRNHFFVAVNFCAAIVAIGCGGGGSRRQTPPPPGPTFTSIPTAAASEGNAYSYSIAATDPAGGTVSFTLASGPPRAVLTGNTLTWTPTPEESRVENSFRITATTSEGGTGIQTFSVTPTGTVHVSSVDTYWTANGPTNVPHDWTVLYTPVASLVPQSDGSFQSLGGSGKSDGTLEFDNVPGGYYWLQINTGLAYWTDSSNFDLGTDFATPPFVLSPTANNDLPPATTFAANLTGLEPWQDPDYLGLHLDSGDDLGLSAAPAAGATATQAQGSLITNEDLSLAKTGTINQFVPVPMGSSSGIVLASSLLLSNLSLTNGAANTLTGMLTPAPKTDLNLAVQGSAWANLYDNAGPAQVTPLVTSMNFSAQSNFLEGIAGISTSLGAGNSLLFRSPRSIDPGSTPAALTINLCTSGFDVTDASVSLLPGPAPITSDLEYGTFQYGDPFPENWIRPFSFCEGGLVSISDPRGTKPITHVLWNGSVTAKPTESVAPVVSVVQSPTVNGQSLFTASAIDSGNLAFSWAAPVGPAPTGYEVKIYVRTTVQIPVPPQFPPVSQTFYKLTNILFTKQTSLTSPYPLAAGSLFLVEIRALVDGRADIETSPFRMGLPQGEASVVSGVIAVGGEAAGAHKNEELAKPKSVIVRIPNVRRSLGVAIPQED